MNEEEIDALAKALVASIEKHSARLASAVLLAEAVRRLGVDRHDWGTRPCATCAAISQVLGEPFGCDKLRNK